ncbi:hypothetical protein [Maricaulis sp.]|uniref:hypothetical protein n=1 Tax=Maricaulis sp. TaxID=1486257 RepID=UPI0026372808|nr:hypothetical protein [Maricaulis sp.]
MPVVFDMTPEEGILHLRFEGELSTKEIVGTAEVGGAYLRGTGRYFAIIDATAQAITADQHKTVVYWTGGLRQIPEGCRIAYIPPLKVTAERARLIRDVAARCGQLMRFFDCYDAAYEWIRFEHDRPGEAAAE